MLPLLLWALGLVAPQDAQVRQVEYFVAPQYPPLARRATISGQVALKVTVSPLGNPAKISVASSSHPMLSDSAREAVEQWKYALGPEESVVGVSVIYGFSGAHRETDPKTIVRADFLGVASRVFVTTDSVSPVQVDWIKVEPK